MSKKRYTQSNEKPAIYSKKVYAKNDAQSLYSKLIKENTITFGLGPAGTGKTYIAVALAIDAFINGDVDKILLTRPIVAVEDIGYLPGDMHEKINPYIMPLFDALESQLGITKTGELIAAKKIEVLPLAYMRGRTLDNCFIIADEMQNTTPEQMKMLLTRIGYQSKMVITGDLAQSDLNIKVNGLQWASERLRGKISDIALLEFTRGEIVRNPIIGEMLKYLEN